jgi:hypothetical protein
VHAVHDLDEVLQLAAELSEQRPVEEVGHLEVTSQVLHEEQDELVKAAVEHIDLIAIEDGRVEDASKCEEDREEGYQEFLVVQRCQSAHVVRIKGLFQSVLQRVAEGEKFNGGCVYQVSLIISDPREQVVLELINLRRGNFQVNVCLGLQSNKNELRYLFYQGRQFFVLLDELI